MALHDPRLADLRLLAIAARRAQERHRTQPDPTRTVMLTIKYDAMPGEPPLEGASYVYYLPEKAPSAEACPSGGSS